MGQKGVTQSGMYPLAANVRAKTAQIKNSCGDKGASGQIKSVGFQKACAPRIDRTGTHREQIHGRGTPPIKGSTNPMGVPVESLKDQLRCPGPKAKAAMSSRHVVASFPTQPANQPGN